MENCCRYMPNFSKSDIVFLRSVPIVEVLFLWNVMLVVPFTFLFPLTVDGNAFTSYLLGGI